MHIAAVHGKCTSTRKRLCYSESHLSKVVPRRCAESWSSAVQVLLEADSKSTDAQAESGTGRRLPDKLRNWSGRMGGSLSAMVDNLTKGAFPAATSAAAVANALPMHVI